MNTPIIAPGWFYLIGLCDELKTASMIAVIISLFAVTISLCVYTVGICEDDWDNKDDGYKITKKLIKVFTVLSAVCLLLNIFIPSKDTLCTMLAAKYITPANIEAAADCGENVIDYIVEKIGEITEKE